MCSNVYVHGSYGILFNLIIALAVNYVSYQNYQCRCGTAPSVEERGRLPTR